MEDGETALTHARAYVRRNPAEAHVLAELTPGPVPVAAAHAVAVFETLSSTRSVGMAGPHPITLSDLQSYTAVMGTPVTPREARLVLAMDAAARDEVTAHG